ncbi:MAG: hypothetical protein JOZ58_19830 [Acetobacteraceae bacterium]|nr:hypothetical protein [Acetobacteraceae bacterium]
MQSRSEYHGMRIRVVAILLTMGVAFLGTQRGSAAPIRGGDVPSAWALTYIYHAEGGRAFDEREVIVNSDGTLHWHDTAVPPRTLSPVPRMAPYNGPATAAPPMTPPPSCDGKDHLRRAEMSSLRALAAALYDVEIPDEGPGLEHSYVALRIQRDGRSFSVGGASFDPWHQNLDPRLVTVTKILKRYRCPQT